ncbi:MAG: ComEA family DNA-binding protein [Chloroflexi bacterium]|nr:ComEA family DNA-binding protein [Chloroflexota bacterium]
MHSRRRMTLLILSVIAITSASVILINSYFASKTFIQMSIQQTPTLTVDIRGEVAEPGFYELQLGYEINDAIAAAGGYTDLAATDAISTNADAKNRTFIYVPSISQSPQRININTAEIWLLDALPGIGETLAGRIVDYRNEYGPYMSADELTYVSGIGESTLAKIKGKITI